jgi:hypothetical protein
VDYAAAAHRLTEYFFRRRAASILKSLYILLCSRQDIVGHREGDFDFRSFLSQIFPYVTSILICIRISDQKASLLIHSQIVQQLEKHIKIGASFYPNDALGGNIDANLLDHPACMILPRSLQTELPR